MTHFSLCGRSLSRAGHVPFRLPGDSVRLLRRTRCDARSQRPFPSRTVCLRKGAAVLLNHARRCRPIKSPEVRRDRRRWDVREAGRRAWTQRLSSIAAARGKGTKRRNQLDTRDRRHARGKRGVLQTPENTPWSPTSTTPPTSFSPVITDTPSARCSRPHCHEQRPCCRICH